jgi:RNA polymerase sigma factor (TIGR02999 family)
LLWWTSTGLGELQAVPLTDVTGTLSAIEQGNPHAAEQLLPLVYNELLKLAEQKIAREKPGETLDPTALVHEAYLRLVGKQDPGWNGRGHFFAAAAEAMRRILVENARIKGRLKRGVGRARVSIESLDVPAPEEPEDLLAVDEALNRLALADPQAAALVKLKYFAGFSLPQAAQALGIAPRTADNLWAYAKAFLLKELRDKDPPSAAGDGGEADR